MKMKKCHLFHYICVAIVLVLLMAAHPAVAQQQAGEADDSTCIHCNRCMPTIYSGTRCILDDPEAMGLFKRAYRKPWVVDEVV